MQNDGSNTVGPTRSSESDLFTLLVSDYERQSWTNSIVITVNTIGSAESQLGRHKSAELPLQRARSAALMVKITYEGDMMVANVPSNVTYPQLAQTVGRNVRDTHKIALQAGLRMRYHDEVGDFVSITCDDDVALAVDKCKGEGDPYLGNFVFPI